MTILLFTLRVLCQKTTEGKSLFVLFKMSELGSKPLISQYITFQTTADSYQGHLVPVLKNSVLQYFFKYFFISKIQQYPCYTFSTFLLLFRVVLNILSFALLNYPKTYSTQGTSTEPTFVFTTCLPNCKVIAVNIFIAFNMLPTNVCMLHYVPECPGNLVNSALDYQRDMRSIPTKDSDV